MWIHALSSQRFSCGDIPLFWKLDSPESRLPLVPFGIAVRPHFGFTRVSQTVNNDKSCCIDNYHRRRGRIEVPQSCHEIVLGQGRPELRLFS